MNPLTAKAALDRHYLEARCLMLDLAAILDRIDRGGGLNDPRLEQFVQALRVLQDKGPGRAEKIQQLFSLKYDASWERPRPRS
jgi:hypothetical protein